MMDVANIDLPYVEKNKNRHGGMRYYLRIDGKRICRLPDDIDSEEFAVTYWRERKRVLADPPPAETPLMSSIVRPNSFRWICLEYMKSKDFRALDVTTQTRRRAIIEGMWAERLNDKDDRIFADMPLSKMDIANLEVLRDRKRHAPFAADERLKTLRQIFDTKRNGEQITTNLARLVEPFNQHSDGHATARPEHMAQYIQHHGPGSKATLAAAILMYTGLRISDASVLGPQHRRGDAFHLRLFKNRNRTPVDLIIPIHPVLEAVLDLHKITALTYLVTEFGKPFSVKGLGNRISDWFRQADLPELTSHSIRKGLATDTAHNEATDNMMNSFFGWSSRGRTSRIYTAHAERARLARAAVAKINWDGVGAVLLPIPDTSEGVAGCGNDD